MTGISSRLAENKEKILTLWEERSLKEVPAAGASPSLALRDSVPLYLDHLSEALETNRKMEFKNGFDHGLDATRIGKLHGAERASNRSYVLTEVIFEYHILREVIFEILEVEGTLSANQRNIILDSIEQAVNDAAVKFSEIHADIQEKFINTLTHDLKNPIAAAKTNAEIILKHVDRPDVCTGSAKKIIGSLNRLGSMTRDLLDASMIRAGERLSLQFVHCDLRSMVREVIAEMSDIHGDRFKFVSREAAIEGKWGCDGLRRAVENLLDNAVKYSTPQTPITVSLKPGTAAVEMSVHNEGAPIPEKEIPLLFQQYRRSKSAQEGTQRGWGLGLTLVKGVVDAHKGKIRVESTEEKGTSFILEIPYAEAAA
jgi:signal transduction histidine kinase